MMELKDTQVEALRYKDENGVITTIETSDVFGNLGLYSGRFGQQSFFNIYSIAGENDGYSITLGPRGVMPVISEKELSEFVESGKLKRRDEINGVMGIDEILDTQRLRESYPEVPDKKPRSAVYDILNGKMTARDVDDRNVHPVLNELQELGDEMQNYPSSPKRKYDRVVDAIDELKNE